MAVDRLRRDAFSRSRERFATFGNPPMSESEIASRRYGRMVPECRKRGIGRSKAYELESSGLIETFSIGRGKYVYLDSLDSLPQRANSQTHRDAA